MSMAAQVEKKTTAVMKNTPARGMISTPHTGATPSRKEEGR
jgi:hypothetical protein